MAEARLVRFLSDAKGTLGHITIGGEPVCFSVERPWVRNIKTVSCIPPGRYSISEHKSASKGLCWKLGGTAPREHILLHVGNTMGDSRGCILPVTSVHPNRTPYFGASSREACMTLFEELKAHGVDTIVIDEASLGRDDEYDC